MEAADLIPFHELVAAGLDGVMVAHLIFPAIDAQLAGFSPFCAERVARKLHFRGVIFADDLGMVAAHAVGDLCARRSGPIQRRRRRQLTAMQPGRPGHRSNCFRSAFGRPGNAGIGPHCISGAHVKGRQGGGCWRIAQSAKLSYDPSRVIQLFCRAGADRGRKLAVGLPDVFFFGNGLWKRPVPPNFAETQLPGKMVA